MRRASKWAVALVASGIVHAGAAAVLFTPAREEVEIAGAAGFEIALLGSFEDAWAAGEPVEDAEVVGPAQVDNTLDPLDGTEVADAAAIEAPLTPVVPSVTTAAPPAAVAPPVAADTPARAPEVPIAPVSPPEAATIVEPPLPNATSRTEIYVPSTPDPVSDERDPELAVAPAPPDAVPVEPEAIVSEPATVEHRRPETVEPETALAMIPPAEPLDETRFAPIPPVEPRAADVVDDAPLAEPVDEVVIPDDVPLPTARPEPPTVREARVRPEPVAREQRRPRRETAPAPQPEKPAAAPPRRGAGAGGNQDRNATRGQADGRTDGRASAQGSGTSGGSAAGNARVSNYPGQVVARLRRSLRNVPRSALRSAQRDVHVAFTVNAGGAVAGIRITQSSGSEALDQAALASVQRAAPFPPIPAEAGRSSWQFSVPLGLAR